MEAALCFAARTSAISPVPDMSVFLTDMQGGGLWHS